MNLDNPALRSLRFLWLALMSKRYYKRFKASIPRPIHLILGILAFGALVLRIGAKLEWIDWVAGGVVLFLLLRWVWMITLPRILDLFIRTPETREGLGPDQILFRKRKMPLQKKRLVLQKDQPPTHST